MTEFKFAKKLQEHRPLLLACEAIGWLHMTGKARIKFLQRQGGQNSDYEYKNWDEKENPPFPWHDRLTWTKAKDKFPLNENAWPGTFTEFIRKHTEKDGGLLGLLQAGHAMASGIEKQSFPARTVEHLSQNVTHMWLSSAFGHPARNLLSDPPELLTGAGWKRLIEQIAKLLKDLEQLGRPTPPHTIDDIEGWWRWREGAVGRDGWLRRAFTSTLAETRWPNNDVTLFAQSYVAAALFKSAVAGAILEGDSFPWGNGNLKQDTQWRLLTIGIGTGHYEGRAVKIGDWTGVRLALDEFFNKVCKLLEVDLAVGSLLYRDHEVCVFSFPGERRQGREKGDDILKIVRAWENWITEHIDGYACEADFETPPYCKISESPSRSLVGMTAEIRRAREAITVPIFRHWDISDQNASGGHVCPVCLVRRNGTTNKQTPCEPCRKRRTGRLTRWMKECVGSDSIWISEVADANDRVALVTMSLDIDPWLDGTRLDALRTQAIPEWRCQNPVLTEHWQRDENKRNSEANPIDPDRPFDSLQQEIRNKIGTFMKNDLLFCGLQDGYRYENDWSSFFAKIVEDRVPNDRPEWDPGNLNQNAAWLTHQLFRKLASPGRIYRFQRQAEQFFYALLAEFRVEAGSHPNRWRTRRLVLKYSNKERKDWKDRHVYNGRFKEEGKPIDLLYDDDLKGFITIFNMSRILESGQDRTILKGKKIVLKDDDNNEAVLEVESVEDAPDRLGCCCPVIPLEFSPVRFRVLLPLEAASACVDRAVAAWNDQFSRVWDRLPLRAGIVAFPRKTPFQAVIETARTVEERLRFDNQFKPWRVTGHEVRDGVVALNLVRHDGLRESRTVPVRLPDGREDVFYPYLAVEDKETRFPKDFQHPKGQVYRHVSDLREGDGIRIHPSLVVTAFMDDPAIRFNRMKEHGLMDWKRMRGTWELIKKQVPSQTALRGAWSELLGRREAWQGPDGDWLEDGRDAWLDLARLVFFQRLNMRGKALDTLVEAAREGVLEWALDWHITVLKQRIGKVSS